ncbi:hypothetical protein FYJ45_18880 [Eisenbergiella tayi]|uniref:Sporulation initiation factor Spo0A C-terminal domain-containing protein n=1 Tax=Eisenbergiella porci TaxID=2652274 RepID=A0A6N7WKJ2_9FIRM|nr:MULTISPECIES: sporulation initiation factor Spo0A C-terminal domain-containing protein [Eisenbergiella]MSS90265.1 hypothetical protein [Eisenbergiella porci]
MSMRRIYRKVAKKYGVSAKEVRKEIQATITEAYTNPLNQNEITKAYQNRVPCKGEIPTPEEMIRYLAKQAKKENQ